MKRIKKYIIYIYRYRYIYILYMYEYDYGDLLSMTSMCATDEWDMLRAKIHICK